MAEVYESQLLHFYNTDLKMLTMILHEKNPLLWISLALKQLDTGIVRPDGCFARLHQPILSLGRNHLL